jgi:hypothetical protein
MDAVAELYQDCMQAARVLTETGSDEVKRAQAEYKLYVAVKKYLDAQGLPSHHADIEARTKEFIVTYAW